MTHAWNQSIDINEYKARQLITSQFQLSIKTICLLDEGWDNVVYLINNAIIFRFPRRAFGVSCMENEIALLPFIAKKVSFQLSAPNISAILHQRTLIHLPVIRCSKGKRCVMQVIH